MERTAKYNLVRERVRKVIVDYHLRANEALEGKIKHYPSIVEFTNKIFADPDIAILDDNQNLPNKFLLHFDDADMDMAREISYGGGQQDMLSAGFVKVIPKEANHES